MREIPRYTHTPFGETPDGYFVDGETVTPISRIIEASTHLDRPRGLPAHLTRIDSLAAAIAAVDAVHSHIPKFTAPEVGPAREDARHTIVGADARSIVLRAWEHEESYCD
jgi:hypothetical protein